MSNYDNMDEWQTMDESDYYRDWEDVANEEFPETDSFTGYEDNMSDVEADADTLASCGWGTDEDYGYYGEDSYYG